MSSTLTSPQLLTLTHQITIKPKFPHQTKIPQTKLTTNQNQTQPNNVPPTHQCLTKTSPNHQNYKYTT